MKELEFTIKRISNRKAQGLNEVPPEAFKYLSHTNKNLYLKFFTAYWKGTTDFLEWHKGQVVLVPKKVI